MDMTQLYGGRLVDLWIESGERLLAGSGTWTQLAAWEIRTTGPYPAARLLRKRRAAHGSMDEPVALHVPAVPARPLMRVTGRLAEIRRAQGRT